MPFIPGIWNEYLCSYPRKLKQISDGDIGVCLLNPKVISDQGEWDAWVFESETGAIRYRSFWELMRAEYESFLSLKDD